MGGYLLHINRLFVVFTLVVGWKTTDSNCTRRMILSHWRVASFFVLACDAVSVTRPSPCARLPHHHVGGSHTLFLSYDLHVMCRHYLISSPEICKMKDILKAPQFLLLLSYTQILSSVTCPRQG
jgi:hypothetical protein